MKIIPIFFYHEKWVVIMRKFVYSPDGGREDGSPSWGRKCIRHFVPSAAIHSVEKMGPLRGDGNSSAKYDTTSITSREDGSPSWGRKFICRFFVAIFSERREDGSPSWGRKSSKSSICSHLSR